MRQLELEMGDLLVVTEDWECLPFGTQCVVHGQKRDKFIFCAEGMHPLSDAEDETGEIMGFERAVNGHIIGDSGLVDE